MTQYISQLFKETKTVIIPGLGALTITNPDTGELMFMPYLKHDDGVLAKFIATQDGISEDEAKAKIASEVSQISSELEAGQKVTFGDYGHFIKVGDDIEFSNSEEDVPVVSETPKEEVSEEPTPEPEVESEKTPEPEPEKEPEVEKSEEEPAVEAPKAEESAEDKVEARKESNDTEKKAESIADEIEASGDDEERIMIVDAKEATSMHSISQSDVEDQKKPIEYGKTIEDEIKEAESKKEEAPKPEVKDTATPIKPKKEKPKKELNIAEKEEIAANQDKLNKLKEQKAEGKKKRKRGAGFYILLFLIVLIVGGGTYVGIFYDDVKEYIPFLSDKKTPVAKSDKEMDKMKDLIGDEDESTEGSEDSETNSGEEGATPDDQTNKEGPTEIIEEPPMESPVKNTPPPQAASGSNNQPFHIVAGVFSSPENAERLAEKIRGMGYPAKTFMRGDKTVVSVQSYATMSEANAALPSVTDAAPKGWILEWRN